MDNQVHLYIYLQLPFVKHKTKTKMTVQLILYSLPLWTLPPAPDRLQSDTGSYPGLQWHWPRLLHTWVNNQSINHVNSNFISASNQITVEQNVNTCLIGIEWMVNHSEHSLVMSKWTNCWLCKQRTNLVCHTVMRMQLQKLTNKLHRIRSYIATNVQ